MAKLNVVYVVYNHDKPVGVFSSMENATIVVRSMIDDASNEPYIDEMVLDRRYDLYQPFFKRMI